MRVSVIIPTKNEPLINELIRNIHESLKYDHEVIVVDKSRKKPKITDAKLVLQKSDGLGKAVLEGLRYAKGDVVVTMDSDFSHDPKDINRLVKGLEEYDIVIGSRFVEGGKTEDPFHRRMVSFFFRKIASSILNLKIEDSMSGFSAVRREVYENLRLNPIGFKIHMGIMFKGKRKGYRILEVPITFHTRKEGKTKVGVSPEGFKEAFRILRYILELKFSLR